MGTYCSFLLNAILANGASRDDSYRMVECSSWRRSKARREPSAPTETKMSEDSGSQQLVRVSTSLIRIWEEHIQIIDCAIMRNKLRHCLSSVDVP